MRFKKQSHHRKAVRFYTTCFGFREPFKVFCDGTFVYHLVKNQILPADDAIAKVLGGEVKLFTTRCVLLELKDCGRSYSKVFEAASMLFIARCNHERRKPGVTCIMETIGKSNAEHFFVGTQDADLRKELREIPGVPLIFGLTNVFFLEEPSALDHQFVKSLEEQRSHVSEVERDLLQKITKKILTQYEVETEEANEDGDVGGDQNSEILDLQKKKEKKRNPNDWTWKDRPKFKRKKAKGPNPLSCLKKKKKVQTLLKPSSHDPVSESEQKKDGATKRTRKRKRSRKPKTLPTETTSTC